MDIKQIVIEILKEQGNIVGIDVSVHLAKLSGVVEFRSSSITDIEIKGDNQTVLNKLIESYDRLFGQASVEVCKGIIRKYTV